MEMSNLNVKKMEQRISEVSKDLNDNLEQLDKSIRTNN